MINHILSPSPFSLFSFRLVLVPARLMEMDGVGKTRILQASQLTIYIIIWITSTMKPNAFPHQKCVMSESITYTMGIGKNWWNILFYFFTPELFSKICCQDKYSTEPCIFLPIVNIGWINNSWIFIFKMFLESFLN